MKTILIVGAYSSIAEETAKVYAAQGNRLILWGRSEDRLKSVQQNLKVLGADDVHWFEIDLNNCADHAPLLEKSIQKAGNIDLALVAHGTLPDQSAIESDFSAIEEVIHTNFLTYASILTVLANYFENQKGGTIAAISSVAADRGRKSNYIYGAAKAGASTFIDGLRGRMASFGVHVVNIKPGMVDTPMTAHLKKGALFAQPKAIATGIVSAIAKKKHIVYLPGYWRLIMFIIRSIPEFIFKKTNF